MRLVALSVAALLGVTTLSLGGPSVANAAPAKETKSTNTQSRGEVLSAKTVKVRPGDHLSKLAAEHGTTPQRLFDANLAIENPDLIFPGDDLRIPDADEQLPHRPFPAVATSEPAPASQAAPAPTRSSAPISAPYVAGGSVWDQLAQCESGGNWAINTGNGFYGGLQFTLSSWQAVGGTGLPSDASREEQIMRSQALQAVQGWGAWPACSDKLGLR